MRFAFTAGTPKKCSFSTRTPRKNITSENQNDLIAVTAV